MNDDARQKIEPTTIKVLIEHGVHDFSNSILGDASGFARYLIMNLDMSGCDFSDAEIHGILFLNCAFASSIFRRATFKGVAFADCNLDHAQFDHACISKSMIGSAFKDVNFAYSQCAQSQIVQQSTRDYGSIDARGAQWKFGNNLISIYAQVFTDSETDFDQIHCPQKGEFDGWKALRNAENEWAIAHLLIPEDAERSSGFGIKCRCSKAQVLDIYMPSIDRSVSTFEHSSYCGDAKVNYIVGEMICPDKWDPCRWNECSHGIHFFMSATEAIRYAKGGIRSLAQLINNKGLEIEG